ncbi:MAG: UDP-N-acetylglucosamine 2-epimerase (non-hydrolyzing) [Prochlorococcus marinus XMU1428]|nr:UDP-N-acetylglucosamine 2-epimerase (non-hydrolyzing) [Prochlorococcus marinus XMU1428]
MKEKPLVSFVFGTRPEAIKLAPVILKFQKCEEINTKIIFTGQHKDLIKPILDLFNLKVDKNLNIMKIGQSLAEINSKILLGLTKEFELNKSSLVVVQGDTTSAMAASLAGFYKNIKIAHIEAGLRTDDLMNPFPEEANRRIISQIATLNFAPTAEAKENLLRSGISSHIEVTGNTVIDALMLIADKQKLEFDKESSNANQKFILATVHRRENWGSKLEQIAYGFKDIVDQFQDISIIIPMHPNNIVRKVLKKILGKNNRIVLTESLPYDQFIKTMYKSKFILTDSGGLQEEAPSLNKPVLILRNTTERQEAVNAGTAKIIGTKREDILREAKNLILNNADYQKMANAKNPFGDGNASERILKSSKKFLFE